MRKFVGEDEPSTSFGGMRVMKDDDAVNGDRLGCPAKISSPQVYIVARRRRADVEPTAFVSDSNLKSKLLQPRILGEHPAKSAETGGWRTHRERVMRTPQTRKLRSSRAIAVRDAPQQPRRSAALRPRASLAFQRPHV